MNLHLLRISLFVLILAGCGRVLLKTGDPETERWDMVMVLVSVCFASYALGASRQIGRFHNDD